MTAIELQREKRHVEVIWDGVHNLIEERIGKSGFYELAAVFDKSRPYYDKVLNAKTPEAFWQEMADLEFFRAQIVVLSRFYSGTVKEFVETYYDVETNPLF